MREEEQGREDPIQDANVFRSGREESLLPPEKSRFCSRKSLCLFPEESTRALPFRAEEELRAAAFGKVRSG